VRARSTDSLPMIDPAPSINKMLGSLPTQRKNRALGRRRFIIRNLLGMNQLPQPRKLPRVFDDGEISLCYLKGFTRLREPRALKK